VFVGSRAAALVGIVDMIAQLGGDPDHLFAKCHIRPEDLSTPDHEVPTQIVGEAIIAGADISGCDVFGARLAGGRDLSTYLGVLGRMVWAAPTLQSALSEFSTYIEIHVGGSRWTVDVDGELGRLRNSVLHSRGSEQLYLHNIVLIKRLLSAITGNQWKPYIVHFTSSQPREVGYLHRVLQCPIEFDSDFNGIDFHSSDLQMRLATNDTQLSDILRQYVASEAMPCNGMLTPRVSALIQRNLAVGVSSLAAVLRFFPCSRATFQRTLSEVGNSYQALLDAERCKKACELLSEGKHSVGYTAHALGYASTEAFSRAFKRHFSIPPSKWRARSKLHQR
jgi:AraC-like DNA-binding protein|tara:strand:+ start:1925 stop:2932 length:1008 start_codon:yes stop_codon:yes gene_type:complete